MTLPNCIRIILDVLSIEDSGESKIYDIINDHRDYIIRYYTDLLSQRYDWAYIAKEAMQNLRLNEDKDCLVGTCFIHTFNLTPSGKIYMPWSTNITEAEAYLDQLYEYAFSQVCKQHGLYLDIDGDYRASLSVSFEDYEDNPDNYNFLSNEDYEAYKEIRDE